MHYDRTKDKNLKQIQKAKLWNNKLKIWMYLSQNTLNRWTRLEAKIFIYLIGVLCRTLYYYNISLDYDSGQHCGGWKLGSA